MDQERKFPEKEKRLILLYMITGIGRISDLQLLQLLFEIDLMNYFDMMLTLQQLCAQGQCVRTPGIGSSMYSPTEAGQEAVRLFARDIPASVRDLLDEKMPLWKEKIRDQQAYPARHHQTARGEYALEMSVMEKEMEMLKVSLSLPTEEMARQFEAVWPQKAGEIYRYLFSVLAEQNAKEGAE